MTALLEAIVWNNEGAKLLQTGRMRDAISSLRQAVSTTKTLMDFTSWEEANTPTVQTTCNEPTAPTESDICSDDNGTLYMYNCPLQFPIDLGHIVCLQSFHSSVQDLSLHIIFNLALACQCYGQCTGMAAPRERAMDLYQVVLTSATFWTTHEKMSPALLHCLVLNNMALLHYEFGEHEDCLFCLDCIDHLNAQTGCLEEKTVFLNDSDAAGIKVNLMSRQLAAAAPMA